jgi:hypothetical protein
MVKKSSVENSFYLSAKITSMQQSQFDKEQHIQCICETVKFFDTLVILPLGNHSVVD